LNRRVLKLILALAIPIVIAWFFIYSQQQATVEVAKYKEEQKANPTSSGIEINNYALKEVDDHNRIHWQLIAKKGSLAPDNKDVKLDEVKVEYYDAGQLKMKLVAPRGEANEATHYVKLLSANGKGVVAEGDGGKNKFRAAVIELIKKNQFLASGGVIIESGEAKVTGDQANGTLDMTGPKNFKIIGNTHAEIAVQ
jgi:LPS export ABC transporter protein LptC